MSGPTPEPLPPHSPACLPTIGISHRDGGSRYICINTCPRRLALNGEPLKRTHDDPAQLRLPGTEPYYG
jgi:hypothetical protein